MPDEFLREAERHVLANYRTENYDKPGWLTIMSAHGRALIMGMAGPAIQAIGFAWEAVHLFTGHTAFNVNARHLVFEPAVLVVVVGFLVSIVCIPAALEVVRAAPEELELPKLGAEQGSDSRGRRAAREWSR